MTAAWRTTGGRCCLAYWVIATLVDFGNALRDALTERSLAANLDWRTTSRWRIEPPVCSRTRRAGTPDGSG